MGIRLQKVSIDIEKPGAIKNADDVCPEQLLGVRSGSLTAQHRRAMKTMPDQEYVKLMEERYGIGEEGTF